MSRLKKIFSHLMGRRGALLILAIFSEAAALVFTETAGLVFALVGLAAAGAFGLMLSFRLSQLHAERSADRGDSATPGPSKVPQTTTTDSEKAELLDGLSKLRTIRSEVSDINTGPRPSISIVMPCFNEERYVGEAIASVRGQTFDDWECIVVDDASKDSSLSAIVAATAGDSRFVVLRTR